jgi:hypothetical protein
MSTWASAWRKQGNRMEGWRVMEAISGKCIHRRFVEPFPEFAPQSSMPPLNCGRTTRRLAQ